MRWQPRQARFDAFEAGHTAQASAGEVTNWNAKMAAGEQVLEDYRRKLITLGEALLRLGALLSRASGDDVAYRDLVTRYRAMAESLGFEGHIAWAEALIEDGVE